MHASSGCLQTSAFAGIAQHYYAELVSRNPVLATWLGEHSLTVFYLKPALKPSSATSPFFANLKPLFALCENDLSIDEQIDRQAVIHLRAAAISRRRSAALRTDDLAMNIGDALFLLFIRDFAPLSERVRSMISRLKAVPAFS